MINSLRKRATVASVSLAVMAAAIPVEATADAAPTDRRKGTHAAQWQATQLHKGRIHNGEFDFDDWGLTIDSAIMLAADGTQRRSIRRVTTAIENNYFDEYVTFGRSKFAGPMAKTLLAAKVLDQPVRNFGNKNLRKQVLGLVARHGKGFEFGRLKDRAENDYSNTFTQAYGVLGLARTGGVRQAVVNYLGKQQCRAGYFRLEETAGQNCNQADGRPDIDATALAVQALVAARRSGAHVPARSVKEAARWLIKVQRRNGSFGGGVSTAGANTNSTGLAAQALALTHRPRPQREAADWVSKLQITSRRAGDGPAARDIGAIAYNTAALRDALDNGIRGTQRDQFRRATPMAFFALVPKSYATISAP